MVNFKLEIKQVTTGSLVKCVLFRKDTQQDAKDQMYDIFREEAAKLEDGEYYAELFRPIENTKEWMIVSGSPKISCTVRFGAVKLDQKRINYVKKIDDFLKERLGREVAESVINNIKKIVLIKNLHHGTDENSSYLKQWEEEKGVKAERCANLDCENTEPNPALVGAHVIKGDKKDGRWYICPLCHKCNSDNNNDLMRASELDLILYRELSES